MSIPRLWIFLFALLAASMAAPSAADAQDSCDPVMTCSGSGTCSDTGECICNANHIGANCNQCVVAHFGPDCQECPGGAANPCSGHGTCSQGFTGTGECSCNAPYAGSDCSECATGYYSYPTCRFCNAATTCSGSGTCSANGFCTCNPNHTGANCNVCVVGHFGPNCQECPGGAANSCFGHGTCSQGYFGTGACSCAPPYSGADCNAPTITGLSPTHGPEAGGTPLAITGVLFGFAGSVTVGGTPCPVFSWTDTQISCLTPAGSGLDQPVVVRRASDNRSSAPASFDYADDLDFGDAPDPGYPTLLSSNGARSLLVGNLRLGSSIDAEADGQPSDDATGDDASDLDDEDGVTFGTLRRGQTATLSIQSTGIGVVSVWIDFDGDGNWSDAGEQVLTDQTVGAGANQFAIAVPASASTGFTFARARLTSVSGLSPTDEAPDGEVEDDRVQILEVIPTAVPTATSTVTPTRTPTPTPTAVPTSTPTRTATPRLVHVGDLDGSSDKGLLAWRARVGVAVHDGAHSPVAGATVTGSWSRGASSSSSCVTGANGRCTLESGAISHLQSDVTLSATGVSSTAGTYAAALNHDPDGDSNGNTIRVRR